MYRSQKDCDCGVAANNVNPETSQVEEEPSEVFSRALKRKFTELDEITQRLRLRLSKVTEDEFDNSDDGNADEFERDINTLCIEDDFDLIDFEEEARNFNLNLNREDATTSNEGLTNRLESLLAIRNNNSKEYEKMQIGEENKASSSETTTSLTKDNVSSSGKNFIIELKAV